jgi:hypothetical protein
MDWFMVEGIQTLILFLANVSLVIWFRSESRKEFISANLRIDAAGEVVHSMQVQMADFQRQLLTIMQNDKRQEWDKEKKEEVYDKSSKSSKRR